MDQPTTSGEKKICNCPHHKVVPWMIILIGILIILNAFNILTGMATWALIGIFIVIAGVVKLNGRKCNCCSKGK